MAHVISIIELQNMNREDLVREIREKENLVAKLRLGLQIGAEKDSAKYRHERKELARRHAVLAEKNKAEQQKPGTATVTPSSPTSPSKPPLKSRKKAATLPAPKAA